MRMRVCGGGEERFCYNTGLCHGVFASSYFGFSVGALRMEALALVSASYHGLPQSYKTLVCFPLRRRHCATYLRSGFRA